MIKRIMAAFLVFLMLPAIPVTALAAGEDDIRQAYESTGDYMASLGEPTAGGLGGEWMVLGFARSCRTVPDSYYDSVIDYVNSHIDENSRLHATKSTSNVRFIIALTALGKDVTNVGGHDLLAGLNDMEYVQKVGVSGVMWTLMAFDSGAYPTPAGIDREMLVDALLALQVPGGGWAVSGTIADPDMTAMVIQALAPYGNSDPEVQSALDTALEVLSAMQVEDGNFPSQYATSSESVSQIIVALSTLGIDANSDPRFVKNGVSAMDALLSYYVEGGGFKHIYEGKRDGMATEQGYYALTAYYRMLEGKSDLYDMTDVAAEPENITQSEASVSWLWLVPAVAAALILLCLLLRKKLGKKGFSNAVMVIIIAAVAVAGIGLVLDSGVLNRTPELGSAYSVKEIPVPQGAENTCTIAIRCDTVLNNLEKLEAAKYPYVPQDGMILNEVTVEFTPGDSVFDVLQRACQLAEIQLEYSWSPLYDSYYVEGINHLYEFDCGIESGWMFRVNDAFPNYGASAYEVQAGDRIEWCYSCIGLGADLGSNAMG